MLSTWLVPLPCARYARSICYLFLVPIVPPDFIYRETDREGYLSRVFSATGIAPDDTAFRD